MRFFAIIRVAPIIIAAFAAGCGGKKPDVFGNFADARSAELVRDAVGILKVNYSPAKTRLNLLHAYGNDPFGAPLLETLRREGYAIAEEIPPYRRDKYHAADTPNPDGFDFAYVVDRLAGDGGLRISLLVGGCSISRLYSVGGTPEEPAYSPMGDWVRKQ